MNKKENEDSQESMNIDETKIRINAGGVEESTKYIKRYDNVIFNEKTRNILYATLIKSYIPELLMNRKEDIMLQLQSLSLPHFPLCVPIPGPSCCSLHAAHKTKKQKAPRYVIAKACHNLRCCQ